MTHVTKHNVAHVAAQVTSNDVDTIHEICEVTGVALERYTDRWQVVPKGTPPLFRGSPDDAVTYIRGYAAAWFVQRAKARDLMGSLGQQILLAGEKF